MGLLKSLKGLLAPAPVRPAAPAAAVDDGETARRAGNEALQAGRLDEALAHYERYVAARPDASSAHLNLGFALLELQRPVEAAAALRRACRLDPASHEAPFFLARALAAAGELKDAERALEEAVALRPEFEDGWIELGLLRERRAVRGPGRQAFERAAEINPARVAAWQGLARIALLQSDGAAALAAVDRWLALEPDATIAMGMRAEALGHLGRLDEAVATAKAALARDPEDLQLLGAHAALLLKAGHLQEAEREYERLLERAPPGTDALAGRGAALLSLDRHAEALEPLARAAEIDPSNTVVTHNRALALMGLLRYPEAIALLKDSIERHPQDTSLHFDLGIAELAEGDPVNGWRLYENRPGLTLPAPLRQVPKWRPGSDIKGRRIALLSEQGLGDAVHFGRYVPLVIERGASVVLLVPPPVKPLFDGVWPGCQVCTDGEPWPAVDLYGSLLSLPHVLGVAEPLAMAAPYVRAAADRRAHWRERVGTGAGPAVGLVWSGNPMHTHDRYRSIPLALLHAAAPKQGLRFVSLQYQLRDSDRAALAAWPELLDIGGEPRDFADTAALIQTLDAVVCVDTSVAHIAGALGKPLFLLLPLRAEWRWRLHGESTPWYPSARLMRQGMDRRWEPVLQRTMELLLQLRPHEPST